MKRWGHFAVSILVIFSLLVVPASAKSVTYAPYEGYEFNDYDESVQAPVGYAPSRSFYSQDMGLEVPLDAPSDMLCAEGDLFILDNNNNRIVQLGTDFKVKQIFSDFYMDDGSTVDITGAKGFTLDGDGNFYIANTTANEVLRADRTGLVDLVITRPDHVLKDTDAPFSATKVIVDRKGYLYVIADSVSKGAFLFDTEGNFINFFGTNEVTKTGEVIMNYIRKRFMTPEQRKGMKKDIPVMFSNFDFDQNGFLYTVTASISETAQAGTVSLLNYEGRDILKADVIFGDLEWDRAHYSESMHTSLTDIDVDDDGYINLLDSGRGKVFQYTQDGELIAVFGTYSDQLGGFSKPAAVESLGDNVLVLDAQKNSIIRFEPTQYGSNLRAAFATMQGSDTEKSLEAWTAVLKQNTNSRYAYYGLGMAYDAQGKYQEAMEQFKLAGARAEYSKSFREYRKQFVAEQYLLIIVVVVVIAAAIYLLIRWGKRQLAKTRGTAFSALETKYAFPLYTAIHPADGFDQFKTRPIISMGMVAGFVVVWFLVNTLQFFYTGFSFNSNRAMDYSFLMTLFMSAGLFVLFVTANWSVCTLLDGKGSLKEILAVSAYSLLPYLVSLLINIGLSNVLSIEESAFIGIVSAVGLLWSALLLVIGLQSIHQYSFTKTILSILLTFFGMLVIIFLAVLFYTLWQQLINLIRSIAMEISMR